MRPAFRRSQGGVLLVDALTLGFLTLGNARPADILIAARNAGFRAAGLRITARKRGDEWHDVIGNESAMNEIRARTSDELRLSNISGYYITAATQPVDFMSVVDATVALRSNLIVQGCFDPERTRLIATLGRYAEYALSAGVRIAIEFMPASDLKTPEDAQQVLAQVGMPNLGLMIDPLHLWRAGGDESSVARFNPSSVFIAQVCDATLSPPGDMDLWTEAMTARRLLGNGQLPLNRFIDALPAGTELECEIPRQADDRTSDEDYARVVFETTRAYLKNCT